MPERILRRQERERGPVLRSALSRCIGVPTEQFADEFWGRAALLSPANDDFTDLFSAGGGRRARRPARPAHAVRPAGARGRRAGAGPVHRVRRVRRRGVRPGVERQGARRVRGGRDDRAPGPAPDVAAAGRLHAASSSRSSGTPRRSTRTSRRRRRRGSRRTTTPTTCSSCRSPARSTGSSTRPCTPTRSRTRCGPTTAPRSPTPAAATPVIDRVLRPGDALYLPRGWIHSATALGDTSIHLTVGLSAYTRADVVDTLLSLVGDSAALRASLPLGIDVSDPDQLRPIVEETVADLVAALTDRLTRRA